MRRWGWLITGLVLTAAGGVALYLAGFREIALYTLALLIPLIYLALRQPA